MIKNFLEFLNEELRLTKASQSGYTKEVDNPTTNKSLSAGLMLRNKLSEEETEVAPGLYTAGLKKQLLRAFRNRKGDLIQLLNNINFLKDELKDKGILKCEYCNSGPLIIYDTFSNKVEKSKFIKPHSFNKSDGATCDHKQPISKGGVRLDKNNLAVCCNACNQLKADITYDDWMKVVLPVRLSNIKKRLN